MSDTKDKITKHSKETFLVHGAMRDEYWDYSNHVIPPISASTAFRLESTERGATGFAKFASAEVSGPGSRPIYVYERLGEPTVALLEHQMAELEGGESATAFASGMAAISGTILALVKSGHEIVAHKTIYGCTFSLLTTWLPRFDIKTNFCNLSDIESAKQLITPKTRIIYFETPANPTLDIVDIGAVTDLAAAVNKTRTEEDRIYVIVDNTFATPFCQRPLSHGADVVVHSLTKNVMGFGTDMAGITIHPLSLYTAIRMSRKDFGGAVASRAAWNILVYGVSTLAVRMRRQIESATAIAEFLAKHKEVRSVRYPGLKSDPSHGIALKQMRDFEGNFAPGLMVYFELTSDGTNGLVRAKRFMDHVANNAYSLTLAVSLGNTKTLIEAPALMTHSAYSEEEAIKAGMSPTGIRLSLGLEHPSDIIADLEAALAAMNQ